MWKYSSLATSKARGFLPSRAGDQYWSPSKTCYFEVWWKALWSAKPKCPWNRRTILKACKNFQLKLFLRKTWQIWLRCNMVWLIVPSCQSAVNKTCLSYFLLKEAEKFRPLQSLNNFLNRLPFLNPLRSKHRILLDGLDLKLVFSPRLFRTVSRLTKYFLFVENIGCFIACVNKSGKFVSLGSG